MIGSMLYDYRDALRRLKAAKSPNAKFHKSLAEVNATLDQMIEALGRKIEKVIRLNATIAPWDKAERMRMKAERIFSELQDNAEIKAAIEEMQRLD